MDDMAGEENIYIENLRTQLRKSDLYLEYNKVVRKLRKLLYNNLVTFTNSAEQSFVKEVLYRIMEESIAYIADLNEGTFFAATHHTRALLELYAVVEYAFSDAGKKKNFIDRFHLFPNIAFHKIFHQDDRSLLKLSEDMRIKFFSEYGELSPEIFDAFSVKNREDLLGLQSWRGQVVISNLFEKCPWPDVIKSDYEKLCLFIHVSSICRRSASEACPQFNQTCETMLLITTRYALFSYVCIKLQGILDTDTQDKLDDIFLRLVDPMVKATEALGYAGGAITVQQHT